MDGEGMRDGGRGGIDGEGGEGGSGGREGGRLCVVLGHLLLPE